MKRCNLCIKFYKKYPLKKGKPCAGIIGKVHRINNFMSYSPIECSFKNGLFDNDSWGCRTMSELRKLSEKIGNFQIRLDDSSIGVVYFPEGLYLVMTWYKDRGRTGQACIMSDDLKPQRLDLGTAQAILKYYKKL